MNTVGHQRVVIAIALALATVAAAAQAQPTPILIGVSTPMSGHSAAFGRGLQHGVQLAVARANEAGGIDGRRLELLALDDRSDSVQAANNARELLRRGALALTGVHGAPAAAAVAEVLADTGGAPAPLVAPATGAEALREPPRPAVFHLRAGTFDEMNAAMLHLDTVGLTRYALLSQTGAFGDSARFSLEMQLVKIGLRPVATQTLARGTEARAAMAALCAAQPQMVVLAVDEPLALAAIAAGRALRCPTQYLVFSETGAALAARASAGPQPQLAGLLVSQVVPHPSHRAHPLIAEYQRALSTHGTTVAALMGLASASAPGADTSTAVGAGIGYPSVEGYLAMRVVHEALRACTRDIGRACLVQVLSGPGVEVAGQRVQFGHDRRQARPFVEMTLLDAQGRFRR